MRFGGFGGLEGCTLFEENQDNLFRAPFLVHAHPGLEEQNDSLLLFFVGLGGRERGACERFVLWVPKKHTSHTRYSMVNLFWDMGSSFFPDQKGGASSIPLWL